VVAGSAINDQTLNRQNNRKAPATPHTTRPGGVRSGRAPGQSEDEGAVAVQKKDGDRNNFIINRR